MVTSLLIKKKKKSNHFKYICVQGRGLMQQEEEEEEKEQMAQLGLGFLVSKLC